MSVRGESDSFVIQCEICDRLPVAERQGYLAGQSFGLVTLLEPLIDDCTRTMAGDGEMNGQTDTDMRSLPENQAPSAIAPLAALCAVSSFTPPPTVVVVHPRERRRKCTVRAIRERSGFAFCNFPRMPYELSGYIRLGIGGPLLGAGDVERGLLILDGTWRHVQPMEKMFANVPLRSLPPVITAYPRTSKVSVDPDGGLATIEAIYAAYRLLGRDTTGLLDHYHWADEFVTTNQVFWPSL